MKILNYDAPEELVIKVLEQVEFTPAYYQAKEDGKSFEILDQASKIMEEGKITFSIWLPKQCWTLYGTQKKEVTLKIGSNRFTGTSCDLE